MLDTDRTRAQAKTSDAEGTKIAGLGVLELRGVGRRFGTTHALSDFNLTVSGGEFVALLGPSGCGKSTALNSLAGLLPLTAGSIVLDGERVDTIPPEKRDFGMVFQNYALFPHLSVTKNVGFGLSMRRLPKSEIESRTQEALALVQLEDQAHKLPGQLSGGQQQRVAIARAVALRPRLVLMDEPLSNLDAKLRIEMRAEIRRLHQLLGLTTIYVTHDQEEALSMADRLVVMRTGQIQQVGTPEEVYSSPANAYVAGFMGYRNQVHGIVSAELDNGTVRVDMGDFSLSARPMNALKQGDQAVVAIRPDELRPITSELGALDGNSITARPSIVEYQGTTLAIQLVGPEGQRLYMRIPGPAPAPGESVELTAPASRVLAYSATSEGAEVAESGS